MHDHLSDPSGKTARDIRTVFLVPAFVKEAEDPSMAAPTAFADMRNRRFPINDPGNTWLSLSAFLVNSSKEAADSETTEHIHSRLEDAARLWEIPKPVMRELPKPAAGQVLMFKFAEDDEPVYKVSIRSAGDLQRAADNLVASRHRFPWEMRQKLASDMLNMKEAADLTEDARTELRRTAGIGVTPASHLTGHLSSRADLYSPHLADKTPCDMLKQISFNMLGKTAGIPTEQLRDLAGFLDQCDRLAGLHLNGYAKGCSPEEICFAVTQKEAEDILASEFDGPTGPLQKSAFDAEVLAEGVEMAVGARPSDPYAAIKALHPSVARFVLDRAAR